MALADLAASVGTGIRAYDFEEWNEGLRDVCGHFRPVRHNKSDRVRGVVRSLDAGGVELAHIANDLDHVRREYSDIRADFGEYLFLLIQLQGECGVENRNNHTVIRPGDCVLVDSASPSTFYFGGRFSNHISVHLPRQLIFSEAAASLDVARTVEARDPMATMLLAMIAKLIATKADEGRARSLRPLLFEMIRQAFAPDQDHEPAHHSDNAAARLEIVQTLIDRHLTEMELSPRWLARKVGVSLRTLQEDFGLLGTTPTSHIRRRRLLLVRDRLRNMRTAAQKPNISDVAYSAGFNDISYFNRSFKELFHCSPKEIISG